MNICEHLTASASIFPERTAIRFEEKTISYARLDELSRAAAKVVAEAGIQPGDRVAIMLANVPAFAVWYYAALRIGAIAVSISTRSASTEVDYFITDSGARLLVSDETLSCHLQPPCPIVTTDDMGICLAGVSDSGTPPNDKNYSDGAQTSGNDRAKTYVAHPNDPAAVLYTSGTTGFAKGATLSHLNVRSNVHAFNHLCNQRPDDVILLAVPLFHCFGQNALLNSALNVGATLVLQRRFDLNESKRLIAEHQVTQLYGVPMMFQLLLESCEPSDLASVNYCFSAAATLPIQVGQQWQQKFSMPIYEGYGLTETSPFASYNHRDRFVSGSIGTPIDCVEMKIVDTETGAECKTGELGEIAVRGPNVMLGYWNRTEETALAVRDNWFYSGDIGRVDDYGFFYIVDRVKDMIAVGGMKVFPAEVERILLDHPAVSQVAVVGIQDDIFGEQVVAFVVLAADDLPTDEQLDAIRLHGKKHLANYKVPRVVVPIDELPRNPSGKVLKRELREIGVKHLSFNMNAAEEALLNAGTSQFQASALKSRLESAHPSTREAIAIEFVQNMVQLIANNEESPNANDGFLDAGMDSLMIVELSNQLQLELGSEHEIPATLIFDYPKISDLSSYLVATLFPSDPGREIFPSPNSPEVSLRSEIESLSEDEALNALMRELDS